ncbi:MAG TPA: acetyl-CoA carboxylase biotin carboxyl carrier protein subunit [Bacteroidales bacterium]|nr:acetyl-CoA carboxylase biotin carboxyl carrier protein subunit [Bacteroidales bacterium]
MSLEIKLNGRTARVMMHKKQGHLYEIEVDDKMYHLDALMVEQGVYSVLHDNTSYNVELIEKNDHRHFNVNTLYHSYDVEIIDAETKYKRNRSKEELDDIRNISSPMPGKIVKIPVKVGDHVKAGDTVVIVSAMKMESEYKVQKDRVVSRINVKEGDIVESNQVLIVVE